MSKAQVDKPTLLAKTNAKAKEQMTLQNSLKSALKKRAVKKFKTYSDFQRQEDAVVQELLKQGFSDPRLHSDLRETTHFLGLEPGAKDRAARRFILKLEYRNPGELQADQVREENSDREWLKNTLVPRIEKRGTLEYPIYVTPGSEIVHGHNRRDGWVLILDKNPKALKTSKIPTLVLSDPYFVDVGADKVYPMVGASQEFNAKVSQIIPNKKQENNPYSMVAVSIGVRQMYNIDPTMQGLNPGGLPFYDENDPDNPTARNNFNLVMDRFYEGEFSLAKRTEIRKLIHKDQSQKLDHTFDTLTVEYANMGWPTGIKSKGKRHKAEEHFVIDDDPVRNPNGDKKILHRMISTAGSKHKQEVRSILVDKYQDGTLDEISGFRLILELEKKARSTIMSVNDKHFRNYIANQLTGINIGSKNVNWPRILTKEWSPTGTTTRIVLLIVQLVNQLYPSLSQKGETK
jgi:hypothetical protein